MIDTMIRLLDVVAIHIERENYVEALSSIERIQNSLRHERSEDA